MSQALWCEAGPEGSVPLHADICAALEIAYRSSNLSSSNSVEQQAAFGNPIFVHAHDSIFELTTMHRQRIGSKPAFGASSARVTTIQRIPIFATWEFDDGTGRFVALDAHSSACVEHEYQMYRVGDQMALKLHEHFVLSAGASASSHHHPHHHLTTPADAFHPNAVARISIEVGGGKRNFLYDFRKMTQTNTSSGTARSLRRIPRFEVSAPSVGAKRPLHVVATRPAASSSPEAGADEVDGEPSLKRPRHEGGPAISDDDDEASDAPMPSAVPCIALSIDTTLTDSITTETSRPAMGDLDASLPVVPQKVLRLLFPSLSTAIFHFDITKAAQVASSVLGQFLQSVKTAPGVTLELCLIDFPKGADSETVTAFKKSFKEWHESRSLPVDPRFQTVMGDVAVAADRGQCDVIVNAANMRLAGGPSTSGINRAIHLAAGPQLAADTRERYPHGAKVGVAYDVALRPTSPLALQSGVKHIIHVVGPNMNPSRPNCLYGDYGVGCAQLKQCYENILERFVALTMPLDLKPL